MEALLHQRCHLLEKVKLMVQRKTMVEECEVWLSLDQLEERASVKLQSTDAILLWMIRCAAMVYSRHKIGEDGKTPYERQMGRKCNLEVVPFGEFVRYKK